MTSWFAPQPIPSEAIFFFCCSFSNTMLLCKEAASQEQRATRWMELLEMILNNVMQGMRNARST